MKPPDTELHQRIALFRYGLINQLLPLQARSPERQQRMAALSAQDHRIPGSTRVRVAEGTLREWMRAWQAGGFDALIPRPRADRDHSRRIDAELAERLIAIRQAQPKLSVRLILEQVRSEGRFDASRLPPVSTVYRLLQHNGLMGPVAGPAGQSSGTDRRRFAFERAGQLWTSDVMHGPSVWVPGRGRRKAYLIAFLDDATRVVCHAEFALSENTATFLPLFRRALIRRGRPERLYVDNGANYRSHHLALVCAKLGVALIHSRPHTPQGRGKIERFFRTVRAQFLTRLTGEPTASLAALNRRLASWIEGEYHLSPHAGLNGATPLDHWAQVGEAVRYPEPGLDLDDLFLFEAVRKVGNDRTVSLNGVLFEVDAALVGERVTLRYDPASPQAPVQVVHQGKPIERARRVDLYANCFVKRHPGTGRLDRAAPAPAPVAPGQMDQADTPPPLATPSPLTMAALAHDLPVDDQDNDGDDDSDNPNDHDNPSRSR